MAGDCSVNFLNSWTDNKITGIGWLQGFMERHKNLILRKPENTSRLFRATAFNKTNVMEFFDNHDRALKSWKFTADRVYIQSVPGEMCQTSGECSLH